MLPINQRVIANDLRKPTMFEMKRIAAPHMLLMVTPASSSVIDDILPRPDAAATFSTSTTADPTQAAMLTPETGPAAPTPKQIASTAPSEAPPETPSV